MDTKHILEQVRDGAVSVEEAEQYFRRAPFEELGYAKLDTHRRLRSGFAEVVFCSGKANDYLVGIFQRLAAEEGEVLGTRATPAQAALVQAACPGATYDPISRLLKLEKHNKPLHGNIAVCTAGTADIAVAEEAAQTAEFFGSKVTRVYDVGVSGLHRLLANLEPIPGRQLRCGRGGHGGRTCQRHWRTGAKPGHCGAHLGGVRRVLRRRVGPADDDQLLRQRHCHRQH